MATENSIGDYIMRYVFEKEDLTCVSLEKELGLKRGDIKEISVFSEGAVVIETAFDLTITAQDKLKTALAKRNLPQGRKPKS